MKETQFLEEDSFLHGHDAIDVVLLTQCVGRGLAYYFLFDIHRWIIDKHQQRVISHLKTTSIVLRRFLMFDMFAAMD